MRSRISLAAPPLTDAGFARARKIHLCPLIPPAAQAMTLLSRGNKCQIWQIFVEALEELPNYFIQSIDCSQPSIFSCFFFINERAVRTTRKLDASAKRKKQGGGGRGAKKIEGL